MTQRRTPFGPGGAGFHGPNPAAPLPQDRPRALLVFVRPGPAGARLRSSSPTVDA